jgi:hypothetical protein
MGGCRPYLYPCPSHSPRLTLLRRIAFSPLRVSLAVEFVFFVAIRDRCFAFWGVGIRLMMCSIELPLPQLYFFGMGGSRSDLVRIDLQFPFQLFCLGLLVYLV